ncbi:MAG: PIN domain-containing protein [Thermoplasmata archaeon]
MIILDTNALIYSIKEKIPLERFIAEEIGIPTSAVEELKKLSVKNANARIALKTISRYKTLKVESSGDDGIIEAAQKYGGTVVTNDRALSATLRDMNFRVTSVSRGVVRRL